MSFICVPGRVSVSAACALDALCHMYMHRYMYVYTHIYMQRYMRVRTYIFPIIYMHTHVKGSHERDAV